MSQMNSFTACQVDDVFVAGEIKPFFRSFENEQIDPNVTELTGSTFHSTVMNSDSHVLILVYHRLSRTWRFAESAVRGLARDPEFHHRNVLFVQIDASTNDLPAFLRPQLYPAIYFIAKSDKKNPIFYPGTLFEEYMVRHFLFEELGKVYKKQQQKIEL